MEEEVEVAVDGVEAKCGVEAGHEVRIWVEVVIRRFTGGGIDDVLDTANVGVGRFHDPSCGNDDRVGRCEQRDGSTAIGIFAVDGASVDGAVVEGVCLQPLLGAVEE